MYKKAGAIGLIDSCFKCARFIIRVKTSILPFAPLVALVRPPTTPNLRSRNTFQRSGTPRTEKLVDITNKKTRKAASQERSQTFLFNDQLHFNYFYKNFKIRTM
jgi:hypothetical protein